MPFTFSHPAIVLPMTFLPRHWFSLTGLIVGSLTPDFEYFLRMKIQSNYSHTLFGILWFDLPLGILLAFIFHNIVRDSLFDNLPTILKSRLIKFKQFEWNEYYKKNFLIVIVSILIGTGSHIFWDSFTHDNGYFVRTISVLTTTMNCCDRQVPVYKILQHSSTLLGGIITAIALFKITSDKNVIRELDIKYWSILIALALTIIAVRLFIGLDYKQYGHLIVTGISAGLISLILTPIILRQKITTHNT
jgi:hypothetical protein